MSASRWTINDQKQVDALFAVPAVRLRCHGFGSTYSETHHLRRFGRSLFIGSQSKANELLDGILLHGEPCGQTFEGGQGI